MGVTLDTPPEVQDTLEELEVQEVQDTLDTLDTLPEVQDTLEELDIRLEVQDTPELLDIQQEGMATLQAAIQQDILLEGIQEVDTTDTTEKNKTPLMVRRLLNDINST